MMRLPTRPDRYVREFDIAADMLRRVRVNSELRCLGRNLAVAGALCAAFDLGWRRGAAEGDVARPTNEWRADVMAQWIPNIAGEEAP